VNPLQQLLTCLEHLNSGNVGYLLQSDAESILVIVRSDAAMHEVAFFADGAIEMQSFEEREEAETVTLEDLTSSPEFRT